MVDGIVTLPRAGTIEVIQEFANAPSAPARPILNPVIIGSSFQIVDQGFAGFYIAKEQVLDELVGTGNGTETEFQLDNDDVLTDSVDLRVGSITGTALVPTTDFSVQTNGDILLTPAGVAALGLNDLHAAYEHAPPQTYTYPDIKQGASIDSPGTEVSVFLRTPEDIFDITNGFGVIITGTTVTIPGNIQPEKIVTPINGQVEVLALTDTFVDDSVDFFDLDVRPGDVLRFVTSAAELERSDSIVSTDTDEHTVLTIPDANTITFDPPIASQGGKVEYQVVRKGSQNGDALISYRARRRDLEGLLREYQSVTQSVEELGPDQPDNPLSFAVARCLGATDKTVFAMMVADQDNLTDHQKALDVLEGEEVYTLVPLTLDPAIQSAYHAHAQAVSDPESMRERFVLVSRKARERRIFSEVSSTGSMNVGSKSFNDPNASFLSDGVAVGSVIRLQDPTEIELADVARTELIVAAVNGQNDLTVIQNVTKGTETIGEIVGTGTGAQVVFQLAATQDVIVTSVVPYFDGVQVDSGDFTVDQFGEITFVNPPGLGVVVTADYEVSTITGIQYTVESQELTNFEIARDIAAIAEGFSSRRITITFAQSVVASDGTEVEPYFLNAAIGGMISAVAPNQPLANSVIPGFTAIKHLRKFSDTHFGIMAAGGISVVLQDRDTSPIVMRNWISTDLLNVNTRERSIVNMADYYAKFLRTNIQAIAGRFNITDDFIDNMLRPGINGVNREMITAGFIGQNSKIISIEQSTVNKDQLFVLEEIELFAPANRITITVRIL